jgi:uncharacterized protein (TIGR02145 family)
MQTTAKDKDGNIYETINISEQVWLAENLNVSTFRNGDPIPEAKTAVEWHRAEKEKKPAWCYYENYLENGKKFGKLYNWFAVDDPRGLAPEGWHIPSKKEYKVLLENLSGKGGNSYDELLISGSSGFGSLFGGSRLPNCIFGGLDESAHYWSATKWFTGNAGGLEIISNWKTAKWCSDFKKSCGFSVRCLKD